MAVDDGSGGSFFSRWSQRKVRARSADDAPVPTAVDDGAGVAAKAGPQGQGQPGAAAGRVGTVATLAPAPTLAAEVPAPAPEAEPAPTLDDAAALPIGGDVRRFVARGVDPSVKNAALKRLFADPHYNVMDGLDIYIDDYGRPDPLPASWLARMAQTKALGWLDAQTDADASAPTAGSADQDPNPARVGTATATDSATAIGAPAASAASGGADEPLTPEIPPPAAAAPQAPVDRPRDRPAESAKPHP